MASTNKTPNYDLPQWVAADKPTFLGDMNAAFLDIDTAMHENAESSGSQEQRLTAVEAKATENATNIASVSQVANTAGETATAAQNAASAASALATTANDKADKASALATTANNKADKIAGDINLNIVKSYTGTDLVGTSCTLKENSRIWSSRNDANSLGKIYGLIYVDAITGGSGSTPHNVAIKIPQAFAPVQQNFNIAASAIVFKSAMINSATLFPMYGFPGVSVLQDGSVNIQFSAPDVASDSGYVIWIPPCLYFVEDFGDTTINAMSPFSFNEEIMLSNISE